MNETATIARTTIRARISDGWRRNCTPPRLAVTHLHDRHETGADAPVNRFCRPSALNAQSQYLSETSKSARFSEKTLKNSDGNANPRFIEILWASPARMRRHHIVDIPRFSRIRHRCEDSPESENLARTCPDARYSEKSLNISRQKGESESFSESNLNISPNRRGRCGRRRAGMPSPAQPVRKRKRPGTCFAPQ